MPRRQRRRTSFVLLLSLSVLAPCVPLSDATAQPSASEELNAMLLRHFTGADPDASVVVGRMPPEIRAAVPLPSSVRFLASATAGEEITIFAASASPSAVAEIERALMAQGWTAATGRERGRGLMPAAIEPAIGLCRGEAGLIVQSSPAPGGVDLVIRRVSDLSGCAGGDRRSPGSDRPAMPQLTAPMTSTERQRACMRAREFNGHMSSTVPIPSELTAAALLEQYDRQMEAQGWIRAASVAASTWRRGIGEDRQIATLLVVPGEGECHSVSLSIHH